MKRKIFGDKSNFASIKIYIFLSLVGLWAVAVFMFYWVSAEKDKQIRKNKEVATIFQPVETLAYGASKGIHQLVSDLKDNIYENKNVQISVSKQWKEEVIPYIDSLKQLVEIRSEPQLIVMFESIERRIEGLEKILEKDLSFNETDVLSLYQPENEYSEDKDYVFLMRYNKKLSFILSTDLIRLESELIATFDDIVDYNREVVSGINANLLEASSQVSKYTWIAVVFLFCLIVYSAWALQRFISKDIQLVRQYIQKLSKGSLPLPVEVKSKELDEVADLLHIHGKQMVQLKDFAWQIGEGSFQNKVTLFPSGSELGSALDFMQNSLLKISEEERIRAWLNNGLNKFSEILRKNSQDLEALTDQILSHLVRYMEAAQGGLYIISESHQEDPYMELMSAYAYDRKKYLNKKVSFAESLIGRAWQEGTTIYMKDLPKDYLEVRSGLGGENPRFLLLVPVKSNGEVLGIIEIASFRDFPSYQVEFMEQIAEDIGSTVSALRVSRRTKVLLEESQHLTNTMIEQDEQMRQHMEVLRSTQEEMQQAQIELSEKEGNMRALLDYTTDAILAFDQYMEVTVVNTVMKDLMERMNIFPPSIGSKIVQALPGETDASTYELVLKTLNGEEIDQEKEIKIQDKKISFYLSGKPIYNERQRIIGGAIYMRALAYQKG